MSNNEKEADEIVDRINKTKEFKAFKVKSKEPKKAVKEFWANMEKLQSE